MRRFFCCDVNGFQFDVVRFGGFLHPRNPVTGKGTLVGVVEDKAFVVDFRMFGARFEFRRRGVFVKGQEHQRNAAVGRVRRCETFVFQKLSICQKFPFSAVGGKDAKSLFPLFFGVADALVQKVVGIAVTFQSTGDPQTVDIKVAVRLNGNPCVFRRNVLDKALAALLAAVKYFIAAPLKKWLIRDFYDKG